MFTKTQSNGNVEIKDVYVSNVLSSYTPWHRITVCYILWPNLCHKCLMCTLILSFLRDCMVLSRGIAIHNRFVLGIEWMMICQKKKKIRYTVFRNPSDCRSICEIIFIFTEIRYNEVFEQTEYGCGGFPRVHSFATAFPCNWKNDNGNGHLTETW